MYKKLMYGGPKMHFIATSDTRITRRLKGFSLSRAVVRFCQVWNHSCWLSIQQLSSHVSLTQSSCKPSNKHIHWAAFEGPGHISPSLPTPDAERGSSWPMSRGVDGSRVPRHFLTIRIHFQSLTMRTMAGSRNDGTLAAIVYVPIWLSKAIVPSIFG